jgi:hypothetical protein
VAATGAPVAVPRIKAVLVPTRLGLVRVAHGSEEAEFEISRFAFGPLATVAATPDGATVYATGQGRLRRISLAGGNSVELGGLPVAAERLLVGARAALYLVGRDALFVRHEQNWRAISGTSAAIDALGRLWQGTNRGPLPPLLGPQTRLDPGPTKGLALEQALEQGRGSRDQVLGPLPCAPEFFRPLPDLGIAVGWSRGQVLTRDRENRAISSGARSELQVFLTLSWRFEPPRLGACLALAQRRQRQRQRQDARIAALGLALEQAQARSPAGPGPLDQAEARIEQARLQELLRVLTHGTTKRGGSDD